VVPAPTTSCVPFQQPAQLTALLRARSLSLAPDLRPAFGPSDSANQWRRPSAASGVCRTSAPGVAASLTPTAGFSRRRWYRRPMTGRRAVTLRASLMVSQWRLPSVRGRWRLRNTRAGEPGHRACVGLGRLRRARRGGAHGFADATGRLLPSADPSPANDPPPLGWRPPSVPRGQPVASATRSRLPCRLRKTKAGESRRRGGIGLGHLRRARRGRPDGFADAAGRVSPTASASLANDPPPGSRRPSVSHGQPVASAKRSRAVAFAKRLSGRSRELC